jgi:hypothetical protein
MSSKVIVFSTNSAWNILNFRISLINSLLSNGYKVICLCPYDEYFDKLQDAGFTCRAIPMSQYSKSTLSNLLTFFYYLFYFILYRPDLYLSFTAKPNILGGMAAKFLSISYIPNVAGLGQIFLHNNFFTKLIKYLYRLVLKDSKHVFFQNSDDQFLFVSEKISI